MGLHDDFFSETCLFLNLRLGCGRYPAGGGEVQEDWGWATGQAGRAGLAPAGGRGKALNSNSGRDEAFSRHCLSVGLQVGRVPGKLQRGLALLTLPLCYSQPRPRPGVLREARPPAQQTPHLCPQAWPGPPSCWSCQFLPSPLSPPLKSCSRTRIQPRVSVVCEAFWIILVYSNHSLSCRAVSVLWLRDLLGDMLLFLGR